MCRNKVLVRSVKKKQFPRVGAGVVKENKTMAKTIQAVRGMNDVLPEQTPYWQLLENCLRDVAQSYGYQEIRFPVVEKSDLFQRTIGEETDIVSKEMYTFEDRNGDSLTLRPEGTAGCVRAGIERGLLYNQVQRLWYLGPMFRRERPQKGRYRQFHQFGIEAFGMDGAAVEAEQILMMARVWHLLEIENQISLQINSLGSSESRAHYKQVLVDYFTNHKADLDEDSQRRLTTNPLRILDSKHPAMQPLIEKAPVLTDYLDENSNAHFEKLKALLETVGITYEVNPRIVRGLDYYDSIVYEWVTESLGAQGAVCAGGRYDGLVEQMGGQATPAVGFAVGLERVVALLEMVQTKKQHTDVCLLMLDEAAVPVGLSLAEKIRSEHPRCRLVSYASGSLKSQMKKADKSGARLVLIIGKNEVESGQVTVKYLREDRPQEIVTMEEAKKIIDQLRDPSSHYG